ncbi:hypothetical protein BJ742DRAFT_869972 [Cladochytrium replicatum]|nr:hypothetical protein BJ742DRAFT_869972 [Cladochytrium replicatum]
MVTNPLPFSLEAECRKAAKIFGEFTGADQSVIIPSKILRSCKGLVIGSTVRVGFGSGIVVARTSDGAWTPPSCVSVGGLSGGALIGGGLVEFVMVLNSTTAVSALKTVGNITLGANMNVSVGPVGRDAEVDVSALRVAPIFAYSKSKGLFLGVSFEGTAIVARTNANKGYFFDEWASKPSAILSGNVELPAMLVEHPLYDILATKCGGGNTDDRDDSDRFGSGGKNDDFDGYGGRDSYGDGKDHFGRSRNDSFGSSGGKKRISNMMMSFMGRRGSEHGASSSSEDVPDYYRNAAEGESGNDSRRFERANSVDSGMPSIISRRTMSTPGVSRNDRYGSIDSGSGLRDDGKTGGFLDQFRGDATDAVDYSSRVDSSTRRPAPSSSSGGASISSNRIQSYSSGQTKRNDSYGSGGLSSVRESDDLLGDGAGFLSQKPMGATKSGGNVPFLVEVVHQFDAQDGGDLPLAVGDIVEVIRGKKPALGSQNSSAEWWEGRCNGRGLSHPTMSKFVMLDIGNLAVIPKLSMEVWQNWGGAFDKSPGEPILAFRFAIVPKPSATETAGQQSSWHKVFEPQELCLSLGPSFSRW